MYEIHYQMTLFVVLMLIVMLKGLSLVIHYTLLRGIHVCRPSVLFAIFYPCGSKKNKFDFICIMLYIHNMKTQII